MAQILPAKESDTARILSFIRKLAEYERLSHEVTADEATLRAWLFGPRPSAEVVLAYNDGEAIGFALFFTNFSTFLGKPGLYLEDLFVEPGHRGKGIGKQLLLYLAKLAVERGYGRMNWGSPRLEPAGYRFLPEPGSGSAG